jgi:hypothetical protein
LSLAGVFARTGENRHSQLRIAFEPIPSREQPVANVLAERIAHLWTVQGDDGDAIVARVEQIDDLLCRGQLFDAGRERLRGFGNMMPAGAAGITAARSANACGPRIGLIPAFDSRNTGTRTARSVAAYYYDYKDLQISIYTYGFGYALFVNLPNDSSGFKMQNSLDFSGSLDVRHALVHLPRVR